MKDFFKPNFTTEEKREVLKIQHGVFRGVGIWVIVFFIISLISLSIWGISYSKKQAEIKRQQQVKQQERQQSEDLQRQIDEMIYGY